MTAPSPHPQTGTPLYGAPEGQDSRLLADKARALMAQDRVLLHIALDDGRVAVLEELLGFFAPDVEVLTFPAWDCLPYDRVSPNAEISAHRVSTLAGLLTWEKTRERRPRILLTTINASLQRVMPRSSLEKTAFSIREGASLDTEALTGFLSRNGYIRTETVREQGEYAVRGGIIDMFPSGAENPVRIDLFGDQIETLRLFDPASQRTLEKTKALELRPATEYFLDPESIQRFRAGYREIFGIAGQGDPLYEAVSEGRKHAGMEHWQPLFFEKMATLFDYAPGASVCMDHHVPQALTERLAQIRDFHAARLSLKEAAARRGTKSGGPGVVYHPMPVVALYPDEREWASLVPDPEVFSPFGAPEGDTRDGQGRTGRNFADIRAMPDGDLFGDLRRHVLALQQGGKKVLVAAFSAGSADRLKGLMEAGGFPAPTVCAHAEDLKKLRANQTGLAVLTLESGFVAPDLAVITEQDILGDRLARRQKKRRRADNFLREVSALAPGDLVVHVDHGVGRFEALETVKVGKTLHDCLMIVYDGGDKLFVPVENIDVLSRFGAEGENVSLDKMGGAGWQARKARVKKDLMKIAGRLLEIAAARELRKAEKLEIDEGCYQEFAARFPYQETDDQLRAISDVIGDLGSDTPMDRLVCGDVGFGKTEVALRAAFVAVMSGFQVAIVAPTTLLARQHARNFSERFAGTGIRVGALSRLTPAKDAKFTKEGLADGSVDIVVGTHSLLAPAIKFSRLGLVVVDEEQRFGVKQKERLKELQENVHVLTLTATPIPRTLQMALAGVREMSLIATPPVDRLAIRTFVLPWDPVVLREALLREHYRGGQSFYVCPRIKDLSDVEEALRELVPEIKVVTAHGQMPATDLEDRMSAFYEGQYDVLLATNIIESGLDIPSANTMIVHRADLFGLAQLYQIRGRIGRSRIRAYAYLTYAPDVQINPLAQKRLEVIETLDTLGSGFQLASHDMDIRGAGNLLGEEQSGHIREVGVELYQQMLEEAVAATRGHAGSAEQGVPEDHWSPSISVGASILIPESYVPDLNLRMSLYRRLSDLEQDEDVESFAAEMIDRFGPLPEEVENLLRIVEIKRLCRKAGIEKVEVGPKGAVIAFHKNAPPNPEKLVFWMSEKKGLVKLRPDQKLVVAGQWDLPALRLKTLRALMREMAGLS